MRHLPREWVRWARRRAAADTELIAELAVTEAELEGLIPLRPSLSKWQTRWRKHATEKHILQHAVRLKYKLIERRLPTFQAELRATEFARRARRKFMPKLKEWTTNTAQRLVREQQAAMVKLYGPPPWPRR